MPDVAPRPVATMIDIGVANALAAAMPSKPPPPTNTLGDAFEVIGRPAARHEFIRMIGLIVTPFSLSSAAWLMSSSLYDLVLHDPRQSTTLDLDQFEGERSVLLLAKMCAASVTIRGHWQGGPIIPHIFMGAVLGKIFALAVPEMDPTLIMVCSMAAFNSAATQTPLASALIVLALTGSGEPVAAFLASVVGFLAGQGIVLIENKQSRTEG